MRMSVRVLKLALATTLFAHSLAAYDSPWDTLSAAIQLLTGDAFLNPGGNTPSSCGSPLQVANGNFIQSIPLLAIPGRGPALNIALTYHSFDHRRGPFGTGWTSTFDQRVIETTNGVNVTAVCAGPEGWRESYARNADGSYTPPPYVHTALSKNADGSFALRDKNGMLRNFDATGHMVSVIDRNGNTLTLAYDSTGFLTTLTDAAGRTVTLTKGADGRVANLTDPANRQFKFKYDSNGTLTQIADPLGNQTTLAYDSVGHLTSLADPKGNTLLQAAYNSDGSVASYVQRGETWTITYDPANQKTSETDSAYNSWVHSYNSSGSITKTVDPQGNADITVYDANLNPIQHTDKNGHSTPTTYDVNGNPLTIQDALGNTLTITYDPVYNFPLTVKDRLGGITTFTYDSKGNLTKVTDALGNATQYQYDSKGQLVGIVDPAGNTSALAYDNYGNVTTWTDPLGHKRTSTYDALGSVISTTDANGKTTQFTYDGNRRLTKSVDTNSGQTLYQYDQSGNLLSIAIPTGATTSFQYDKLNRVVLTTNPLGNTTQYAYDKKDNLTTNTDASGNETDYYYDELSRLIQKLNLSGQNVYYTYDKVGNLLQLNNVGANLSFSYDATNRLIQTKTASSSYQPASTITYAYDANGRRISMTDPAGGITKYAYDAVGHLTSLQDPPGDKYSFTYDKVSRRTGLTGPAGITNTYAWDAASRLTALNEQSASANVAFSYTYDPVGNVQSRIDAAGSNSYSYNSLYRLTGATHPTGQPAESYAYDSVGNRTSSSLSTAYTNDAANRLTADATFDYTWSPRGTLTKKTERATGKATSYNYNIDFQLTSITTPTFDFIYYNYDGLGRRIAKSVNNATTQYVYDGPNIIAEYNGSGSLVASYTHGPGIDEVLSVKRSGVTSYFQRDALGSIAQTVSSSGVNSSYKYDSYGRVLSQSGTAQGPYAFQGREYDPESGQHYFRARYYNSDIGRFMSEDILGFQAGSNSYEFAGSNPLRYRDPSGMSAVVFDPATDGWLAAWVASYAANSAASYVAAILGPAAISESSAVVKTLLTLAAGGSNPPSLGLTVGLIGGTVPQVAFAVLLGYTYVQLLQYIPYIPMLPWDPFQQTPQDFRGASGTGSQCPVGGYQGPYISGGNGSVTGFNPF